MGLKLKLTPMKAFAYDLDAIAKAVTTSTRMIYLANPNNPTGSYFNKQALVEFLTAVPNSVLILYDEAYYDFAIDDVPDYPSLLTSHIPNVVTLRTFSKSHGLAGLRIGFGVGAPEIIRLMMKVRLPFEPSGPAEAAGIGALQDDKFLLQTIEVNREGKAQWKAALTELGLTFVESAANFYCVIFESETEASRVLHKMERNGIIVRPLAGFGMPTALRISIGTPQQNARAIEVLTKVMKPTNA
jgi:histidinol-phosphate aminotransferase